MNEKHLGIAIIGCGLIGGFHFRALSKIPAYDIKGVWDAIPEVAKNFTDTYGIKGYNSLRELLSDPEVNVVDICLPSSLHAEYGCQAAAAGKHVIVEKPIDITMEAANRLVKTCENSKVFLAVILQNRFIPSVIKVKQALENNVLGKIYAGEASIKWFRDENYYKSSKWKGTKKFDGGGALINQSIHTIDLLLWFLGDFKSVASLVRTVRHEIEVEDLAMAIAQFKNGAIATVTGATSLKPGFSERVELYGEKGAIALEVGRIVRWKVDGCLEEDYLDAPPVNCASADPAGIAPDNHQSQFTAIAEAILKGEQPPVSGTDAMRALEFILDIYDANERWVNK